MTNDMPKKLLLILFAGLIVACSGGDGGEPPGVVIEFEPWSTAVGPTFVLVTLKDGSGTPIQDAAVVVTGELRDAGVAPVVGASTTAVDGVYQIPVDWTATGDWLVTVEATLVDGSRHVRPFDLTISEIVDE